MRTVQLRYAGDCRKCAATLPVGAEAVYERHVGVFCPTCAPTAPEDIREYRAEARERKAERYDKWAEKRKVKATATIEADRRYTEDIAFNTQPGHIPLRARVIARQDAALESLNIARNMKQKAASLRARPRVAGDAERKRQAIRDIIKPTLKVGMKVQTGMFGIGVIERINRKTARVGSCGASGTYSVNVDISWLKVLDD